MVSKITHTKIKQMILSNLRRNKIVFAKMRIFRIIKFFSEQKNTKKIYLNQVQKIDDDVHFQYQKNYIRITEETLQIYNALSLN